MVRTTLSTAALAAVFCAAACSSDPFPTAPDTSTPPVAVTETFDGQLTINGGVSHPFPVTRIGAVTVTLTALDPSDATIGLSLGTWNNTSGVCQATLSNDAAPGGATITGSASVVGAFCARVYDVGRLSRAILYTLNVTHF